MSSISNQNKSLKIINSLEIYVLLFLAIKIVFYILLALFQDWL